MIMSYLRGYHNHELNLWKRTPGELAQNGTPLSRRVWYAVECSMQEVEFWAMCLDDEPSYERERLPEFQV